MFRNHWHLHTGYARGGFKPLSQNELNEVPEVLLHHVTFVPGFSFPAQHERSKMDLASLFHLIRRQIFDIWLSRESLRQEIAPGQLLLLIGEEVLQNDHDVLVLLPFSIKPFENLSEPRVHNKSGLDVIRHLNCCVTILDALPGSFLLWRSSWWCTTAALSHGDATSCPHRSFDPKFLEASHSSQMIRFRLNPWLDF